jgi:hypothetical protein
MRTALVGAKGEKYAESGLEIAMKGGRIQRR